MNLFQKTARLQLALVFALLLISSSLVVSGSKMAFADSVMTTIPMVENSTGNAGLAGFSTANPSTDTIYVNNRVLPHLGSAPYGWVAVINGSTNAVTGEIKLAGSPAGIAANPVTNKIYSDDVNGIEVIDGASNTIVTTIPVSCSGAVAVNPNTNEVYVANAIGHTICVINGTDNTQIGSISVATYPVYPYDIKVNQVTNKIYVSINGGYRCLQSSVDVIDGSTNDVVATIPVPSCADFVGINPDTDKVYAISSSGITVIDGSNNNSTLVPITIGAFAVSPETGKIYGIDGDTAGQIDVINGVTNSIITTLQTSSASTTYMTVNPDTNRVYVSSPSYPHTVIVIQGTTQVQDTQSLINAVNSMSLTPGTTSSLDAKLNATINYLNSGDTTDATDSLDAFINEAKALSGKNLTTDQAGQLAASAQIIINSLP